MIANKAIFIKSASKFVECPDLNLPEFAAIGRSNVGKSSFVNLIANNHNLSKTSVKPGKTQLMNFFVFDDKWCLVDLPGYGYAKSTKSDRAYWIDTTHEYFVKRKSLKRVWLLVDGSILPQKIDIDFIYALSEEKIPFDIIMTKMDKTNQKNLSLHKKLLLENISKFVFRKPEIFAVSNVSKRGREQLLGYIQSLIGV